MSDKLEALEEAALAATPGPWYRSSVIFNGVTSEQTFITQGNKPHIANAGEKRDAIFIAAASPNVVLELLAALEEKDQSIADVREVWPNGEQDKAGNLSIAPLFTAPPAPAVPDERHPVGGDKWGWSGEYNRGWNACRAAMLQPQNEPQNIPNNIPDGCKWTYDEHDYKWDSACGESWQFTDGGPEDNHVKFCQGCGKPVVLAAAPTPTKAGE